MLSRLDADGTADGGDGECAQLPRLAIPKTCPSGVDLHSLHFRLTGLVARIELHAGAHGANTRATASPRKSVACSRPVRCRNIYGVSSKLRDEVVNVLKRPTNNGP